jgi:hypothetical protein
MVMVADDSWGEVVDGAAPDAKLVVLMSHYSTAKFLKYYDLLRRPEWVLEVHDVGDQGTIQSLRRRVSGDRTLVGRSDI